MNIDADDLYFSFSDWNIGACLFRFELLKSRVAALSIAGVYRLFLICFGVHYWYFSSPHNIEILSFTL